MGRKDDLAVDLIDRDFPRAGQLDPHSRMAAHGGGLDRPDRCAEILHVEPAHQLRRELRVEKIHHQRIPLPANFDRRGCVRNLDEDPAFPGCAALEADLAQSVPRDVRNGVIRPPHRVPHGAGVWPPQCDQQFLALQAGFKDERPVELEDEAGARPSLEAMGSDLVLCMTAR